MTKRERRRRLVLYAIPIVAVLIIAVAVYANYESSRVAYQAQFYLAIERRALDANGQVITTPIKPAAHIGEAGGYLYNTTFLAYGVGGNYPIHTVDTSGFVYIDSKVVRDYTIGDFFHVWGEPLGVNNTLGFKANYTTNGKAPWIWSMCLRAPDGSDIPPDQPWGAQVLKDKEIIDIIYAQITCA